MNGLLLILLSIVPSDGVLCDRCDLTEVNHYFDGEGRKVFVQVIWWDSTPHGYRVRDWRLVKYEGLLPRRTLDGQWHSRWVEDGIVRDVASLTRDETFTQYDPEVADREVLPTDCRKKLQER